MITIGLVKKTATPSLTTGEAVMPDALKALLSYPLDSSCRLVAVTHAEGDVVFSVLTSCDDGDEVATFSGVAEHMGPLLHVLRCYVEYVVAEGHEDEAVELLRQLTPDVELHELEVAELSPAYQAIIQCLGAEAQGMIVGLQRLTLDQLAGVYLMVCRGFPLDQAIPVPNPLYDPAEQQRYN